MDKEYEICKTACENQGCYCPPSHEFHQTRAGTPMFLRAYYFLKGQKDSHKTSNKNQHVKSEETEDSLTKA